MLKQSTGDLLNDGVTQNPTDTCVVVSQWRSRSVICTHAGVFMPDGVYSTEMKVIPKIRVSELCELGDIQNVLAQ